jgi:hypothetical protein
MNEILDAVNTGDEFVYEGDLKLKLQRTIAEGARDLSFDERYILSRMSATIALDPLYRTVNRDDL